MFEKSGNFFHRLSIEVVLTPPPVCFHLLFKNLLLPLHSKLFIKKGSLEEMKGFNDNASAFVRLDIKANK